MSFDSAQPLAPSSPYRDDTMNRSSPAFADKEADTGYPPSPPGDHGSAASGKSKRRPWWFIPVILAAIVALVAAVVIPVYFKVIKPNNDSSSASNSGSGSGSGSGGPDDDGNGSGNGSGSSTVLKGGDGSEVTTETGAKFTYANTFGGFWIEDVNDPFNNEAQAQEWSPPLTEPWDWQNNKIRG